MYLSTPVAAVKSESGLIPAHILLDFWQHQYVYHFLSLLESISIKVILPINLQIKDRNAQPKNELENNGSWATH